MATQPARPSGARASDLTGRQRAAAQKAHAEEQEARRGELTLASQQAQRDLEETILDATVPNVEAPEILVDEIQDVEVELEVDQTVIIRVNEDIKQMTFGAGSYYDFKVGPRYKVSKQLADYLDTLGLVWH